MGSKYNGVLLERTGSEWEIGGKNGKCIPKRVPDV
jgi:hypothetical protein